MACSDGNRLEARPKVQGRCIKRCLRFFIHKFTGPSRHGPYNLLRYRWKRSQKSLRFTLFLGFAATTARHIPRSVLNAVKPPASGGFLHNAFHQATSTASSLVLTFWAASFRRMALRCNRSGGGLTEIETRSALSYKGRLSWEGAGSSEGAGLPARWQRTASMR
jgi:hypothetical protein